jgi:hypothetical protein
LRGGHERREIETKRHEGHQRSSCIRVLLTNNRA